jgi:3-hydroxymyristoyl/3-hydroxydecanoyl-(acyl carrier protein) dehydratase
VSAGFEVGAPRVEGLEASVAVRVPTGLPYFEGHFEGHPVLPAIAQLDALVVPLCRAVWDDLGAPRRMMRLKFRRTIEPGSVLVVRLDRRADTRVVSFRLEREGDIASSGTIAFGEVPR